MTKLLVKYQDNWADEINVFGFSVFDSREEYDEYIGYLTSEMPFNKYIGSIEEIEYITAEQLLSTLTVIEITDDAWVTIVNLLGGSYGQFPEY